MNIKPGDMFEWVYKHVLFPLVPSEMIYTFTLNTRIPCHGLHLCVGVTDNCIHWLSNTGVIYESNLRPIAWATMRDIRPRVMNHEH